MRPDARLPPHGFFSEDTRFVSRWRLSVAGPSRRTCSRARRSTTSRRSSSSSRRRRRSTRPRRWRSCASGCSTTCGWRSVVVVNHRDEHLPSRSTSRSTTDFADLFEVKDGDDPRPRHRRGAAATQELTLRYRNGDFVRETRDRRQRARPRSSDDALRLRPVAGAARGAAHLVRRSPRTPSSTTARQFARRRHRLLRRAAPASAARSSTPGWREAPALETDDDTAAPRLPRAA